MTCGLCGLCQGVSFVVRSDVLTRSYSLPGSGMQQEKQSSGGGGLKKSKSVERSRYENSCYADDDEDNIVFEDFARLRLNEPDE